MSHPLRPRATFKQWVIFIVAFAALCVLLYLLFSQLGWSASCRNISVESCDHVTHMR